MYLLIESAKHKTLLTHESQSQVSGKEPVLQPSLLAYKYKTETHVTQRPR